VLLIGGELRRLAAIIRQPLTIKIFRYDKYIDRSDTFYTSYSILLNALLDEEVRRGIAVNEFKVFAVIIDAEDIIFILYIRKIFLIRTL
jgi:hypothetical protein